MASNFNIVGAIQLRGPNNISKVAGQIKRGLSNINADININVNNRTITNIGKLQTSLKDLDTAMQRVTTQAGYLNVAINNMVQATKALPANLKNIVSSGKNVNTQFQNYQKSIKGTTDELVRFGEQSQLAIRRFLAFSIPAGIVVGLISSFKQGFAAAVDFERELIRVSQVTGRTVDGLRDVTDEVTRLSTSLGASSNSLVEISRILAQTGLSARNTKIALEALAQSTLAPTFSDVKATAEGSIAVMRQFGIQADQLGSTLGSINAVAGQFAVESDDLISAVRRTGGAFRASGGDLNELLALFTSVRSTTRESADSIATGFRTIFTRLQRPQTIQFLDNLGIRLQNLEGNFIGPFEAVRRLNIALRQLETTDPRFASIVEELGGFRQVSKVIPLIQQFPEALKALNVAQQGTTSLSRDAAIAQQSLSVQISKVREEFAAFFREISNDESIRGFIGGALELSRSLIKIADSLRPLIPLFGALALVQGTRFGSNFASGFLGLGSKPPIRRARGGVVPGSGFGDKVPMLAEPGEFVIRRKAVESIGAGKLSAINSSPQRFATGGRVNFAGSPVAVFAMQRGTDSSKGASLETKEFSGSMSPSATKEISRVVGQPVSNRATLTGLRLMTIPDRSANNFKGIVNKNIGNAFRGVVRKFIGYPNPFFGKKGGKIDKGEERRVVGKMREIVDKGNFEGQIFEAMVKFLSNDLTGLSNDDFDLFPNKLSPTIGVENVFGISTSNLQTFPYGEVKRTLAASNVADTVGKAANTFLRDPSAFPNTFISETPSQKYSIVDGKQVRNPDIQTKVTRRALGGSIGSNETLIKAEPGEFVINKKAASVLGSNKLNALNSIPKYHNGGYIKGYQTGGRVQSNSGGVGAGGGLLIAGFASSLAFQFENLSDETTKLVNAFQQVAITASLFSTINSGLVSSDNRVGRGGNAVLRRSLGTNSVLSQQVKRLQNNAQTLSVATGIISASFVAFGQELKSQAFNIAKSGEDLQKALNVNQRGATLSGIGGGLAVGATVGSLIAPGVGTVIGGGVGALAGGIIGSNFSDQQKITDAFNRAKFTKSNDKLIDLLTSLQENRLRFSPSSITSVGAATAGQLGQIGGAGAQRGEFLNQLRQNEVGLRRTAQEIIDNVDSLNQFRQAFGGTGDVLIKAFSELSNKSIREVRREISEQIELTRKLNTNNSSLLIGLQKQTNSLNAIQDFSSAVSEVNDKLSDFSSAISTITGGGGSLTDVSSIFDRAASGSLLSEGRLSGTIGRIFGAGGSGITSQAVGINTLQRDLPGILQRSAGFAGLSDERFSSLVSDALSSRSDIPKNLANVVVRRLEGLLRSRQGGGEGAILEGARLNPSELVNQLITDVDKTFLKGLSDIIVKFNTELNILSDQLKAHQKVENDVTNSKISIEKSLFDVLRRRREAEGKFINAGDVQASFARRQQAITGGSAAFATNPRAIATVLARVERERSATNARIQSSPFSAAPALVKHFHDLTDEATRLRNGLNSLADSSFRLNELQRILERKTADREAKRDLVGDALFGGTDARRDFIDITGAVSALSTGAIPTLLAFPEELRKKVFGFLKSSKDLSSPIFGKFGTGGKLLESETTKGIGAIFVRDALKRFDAFDKGGGLRGLSRSERDERRKGVIRGAAARAGIVARSLISTTDEKSLLASIKEAEDTSLVALEALRDDSATKLASIEKILDTELKNIVSNTNEFLNIARARELGATRSDLLGRIGSVSQQRKNIGNVLGLVRSSGFGGSNIDALRQARVISNNAGSFSGLSSGFQDVRNIKSLFTPLPINVNDFTFKAGLSQLSGGDPSKSFKFRNDQVKVFLNQLLSGNTSVNPEDKQTLINNILGSASKTSFRRGEGANVLNEIFKSEVGKLAQSRLESLQPFSNKLRNLPSDQRNFFLNPKNLESLQNGLQAIGTSLLESADPITKTNQQFNALNQQLEQVQKGLSSLTGSLSAEVSVSHSPITVNMNLAGLEKFKEEVTKEILDAVNKGLGIRDRRSFDGRSPFISGSGGGIR